MMGKSHALSGAVGWLAGCATLTAVGADLPGSVIGAGVIVSAGFSLLPDIDHPSSTVARALGPVSRFVAVLVERSAAALRLASCAHCATRVSRGGHRGITHTAAGALALGLAISALCLLGGRTAGLWVIGFAAWLASYAALSSTTRAKLGDMILPGRFRRLSPATFRFTSIVGSLLVASATAVAVGGSLGPSVWWLGIPAAWGCLAHSLGDAMTISGSPLLWPLRVGSCRWTPVGTPRRFRFRTGSTVERLVVVVMWVAGVGSLWLLG